MDEESGAVCTAGIVFHKDKTRISPESDSDSRIQPFGSTFGILPL